MSVFNQILREMEEERGTVELMLTGSKVMMKMNG